MLAFRPLSTGRLGEQHNCRGRVSTIDTGYAALFGETAERLVYGGLARTHASGEVRLSVPLLAGPLAPISVIFRLLRLAHGLVDIGTSTERFALVRAKHTANQLWTGEQAVRSGTCPAVLRRTDARADSLRRLHLTRDQTPG
ncbi:conserved hypothetical protein [Paraburkholderia piptadeniae]|uniref:Uncharacterized protein n=1 Tax=Paraburkholderia piptadeniae TaxID=1701573 RepID=A0A1N7STW3_9BURK|nr:conserved hypothetical protein [Paraburkholderia piptadeniae]